MKKCMECNAEVDDRASVCPKCGGSTLVGSYSAQDALSLLDNMKGQQEAKEHVDRGARLFMQGKYDEAISECRKAIDINPMNATAHGNLGNALIHQGKVSEAIPWLEKALELNPNLEGVPAALAHAKSVGSAKKSGCFVATACYGNPDCNQIKILRTYRDEHLSVSFWGRILIRVYYSFSPALARGLNKHPQLRLIVRRRFLDPFVLWIQRSLGY